MVTKPQYGASYQAKRRQLLLDDPACWNCGQPATVADHVPPIALHAHVGDDAGCCVLAPSCKPCSDRQGRGVRDLRAQLREAEGRSGPDVRQEAPIGGDGPALGETDPVWDVPWVARLLPVPEGARWPRFMSGPHPDAVGSLGDTVEEAAAEHGTDLRWWQRLALTRLLEVDEAGELCWSEAILSTPRRAGKSWLLRELAWWRLTEGTSLFGEAQTILHTSRTVVVTQDVARPAMKRAEDLGGFRVLRAIGRERIEFGPSQWMVLAEGAAYGLGAGLAICDEAWDYSVDTVAEGIQPTMMERRSPQLLLVSTAHRRATRLIPERRRAALDELEAPRRRLLLEWSADASGDLLADAEAASPVWDRHRARHVRDALDDARAATRRPGEVDPVDMFASQYLNDWEAGRVGGQEPGEVLVTAQYWQAALRPQEGPYDVVAVEDFYGRSFAVAWAHVDPDSLGITVGASIVGSRSGLRDALVGLDADRLLVGASIVADPVFDGLNPEAVGSRETRAALTALRRGVAEGRVFQDGSPDLAEQLDDVRVVERAEGLAIVAGQRSDLVRAAAWTVAHVDASRVVGPALL